MRIELINNTEMDLGRREIIFLLGAGASIDAGMPSVAEVTKKLRESMPDMVDLNGIPCPEYSHVFDLFAEKSPSLAKNYERFFEWLQFICDAQKDPYKAFCEVKIDSGLLEKVASIRFVIGPQIAKLFESYTPKSFDYFSRLKDFIPDTGRLKIFTLNYDCCLEDLCHKEGIDITTGFDPNTKTWNPSLFSKGGRGLNLYKLHSSLRWFGTRDLNRPDDRFQWQLELMELRPEERRLLAPHVSVGETPELILGPASKVRIDDPFLTLIHEFHVALQQAKVCVVIGFSYGDKHIKTMLEGAFDKGLSVVDVNPSEVISTPFFGEGKRYHLLRKGAKKALETGVLLNCIDRYTQDGVFS